MRSPVERDLARPLLHAHIKLSPDDVFSNDAESKDTAVAIDFQDSENSRLELQGSQLIIYAWGSSEVISNEDEPRIKLHALTVNRYVCVLLFCCNKVV